MADSRSILITLKLDSSGGASEGTDVSSATGSAPTVSSSSDSSAAAKAAYTGLAFQALGIAVSEGVAWAEYYCDKNLVLIDDYIGQRNKQIATTQINRGISAISTIGNFALVGSKAGPWGALIGAAVGTTVVGFSIARSNIQGQEQQNIMLNQMNAQLQFTRSRAGWSTHAASIGEDL